MAALVDPRPPRPVLDGANWPPEPYMGQMLFDCSEPELIGLARKGDGAAFAELIRPHYAAAFRMAYGMLHDSQEAEDAVQDAAFTAWKKLGNLHAESPMRPWFLAIIANRCRHVSKTRSRSVASTEMPEAQAPATDIAAGLDLRRALGRLGHDEKLILVLRYYLDMPYEEIASTLGVTPKAARPALSEPCTDCARSCRCGRH